MRRRATTSTPNRTSAPRSKASAPDAGSKANQATARARLSLLSDAAAPSPPAHRAVGRGTPRRRPPPRAAGPGVAGRRRSWRLPRRARDRQRRLCQCQGAAQSAQRRAFGRKSLRDIGFTVSEGVDLDRAAMQKMPAISCARRRARRSRWSTTPATACRSTAATI